MENLCTKNQRETVKIIFFALEEISLFTIRKLNFIWNVIKFGDMEDMTRTEMSNAFHKKKYHTYATYEKSNFINCPKPKRRCNLKLTQQQCDA